MTPAKWTELLRRWSRCVAGLPTIAEELPLDVRNSGWLGFSGASEAQIFSAEARLGTTLPPSYRIFLSVSNGWRNMGAFVQSLVPTERLQWFRTHNADAILDWTAWRQGLPSVSDEEYFVYGERQSELSIRDEYLEHCLQVSNSFIAEGVYLLNPQIRTDDNEWEAWFFAHWLPGAIRYRSFWDLIVAEYQMHCSHAQGIEDLL